ncbi:MAG: lytic transglycosylase domain-containing protein [Bryobacteraceae bacterium]
MEASVARQRAAVAAMRISIQKQRTSVQQGPSAMESPASAPAVPADYFMLTWPPPAPACDPLPDETLTPLIREAAQKEALEEHLLRAVIEEESGFRPCAVSSRGAMGLMQLMPGTAQQMGTLDPFDPRQNLLSGARYLKQLLTRYGGNPGLALAAYNAGPGRVEEGGGVPQIPETVRYIQDILSKLPVP